MKHKNAQLRYNVLNKCFRNKTKSFTISKLLEECNKELNEYGYDSIQKRQLYKDISYMKSEQGWSIDLEDLKMGRERIYRYSNTSYSIENASELNENQKEIVKEALLSLKTMSGIPQFDHIDIDSVCAQLRISLEDKEKREEIYLKEVNEFNRDFHSGKHQEEIFLHIKNKTAIRVFWKNKKKEDETRDLSPYLIKEYNTRWYLLGQSEYHNKTIVYIDKIIKIEESKVNFFEEIREISEKNETENTNTTNNQFSETDLYENNMPKFNDSSNNHPEEKPDEEIKKSDEISNEINDDLLQIPAFLRRQAN